MRKYKCNYKEGFQRNTSRERNGCRDRFEFSSIELRNRRVSDQELADRWPSATGVSPPTADEETFVLSDEIIDRIYGFFPKPDNDHDRTIQACAALQALINVIGILLCEVSSEFAIKAVVSSFAKMLKDLPDIITDDEREKIYKFTN